MYWKQGKLFFEKYSVICLFVIIIPSFVVFLHFLQQQATTSDKMQYYANRDLRPCDYGAAPYIANREILFKVKEEQCHVSKPHLCCVF